MKLLPSTSAGETSASYVISRTPFTLDICMGFWKGGPSGVLLLLLQPLIEKKEITKTTVHKAKAFLILDMNAPSFLRLFDYKKILLVLQ
jgi:hypothetical protein